MSSWRIFPPCPAFLTFVKGSNLLQPDVPPHPHPAYLDTIVEGNNLLGLDVPPGEYSLPALRQLGAAYIYVLLLPRIPKW
jgi:hypothetical protein